MEEISRLIEEENYQEAVDIIEKQCIDSNIIENKKLIKTKVVLLVLLGKFEEALKDFELVGDELTFEMAYCKYRLEKYSKALSIIDGCNNKGDDPRLETLRAQVLYRLERYDESVNAYQTLIQKNQDDDRFIINCLASCVYADKDFVQEEISKMADNCYEALFNYSCYLIYRGKFRLADDILETSIAWAKEALAMEGMNKDDIKGELSSYYLQQALIFAKTNRTQESAKILERLKYEKSRISDLVNYNWSATVNSSYELVSKTKKMLEKDNLGTFQRHYARFNLAVGLIRDENIKKATRILRKLVKIPALKVVSTALLFSALKSKKLITEIRNRAKENEYMRALMKLAKISELPKRLMKKSGAIKSTQNTPDYPGVIGVMFGKKIMTSKRFEKLNYKVEDKYKGEMAIFEAFQEGNLAKTVDLLKEAKIKYGAQNKKIEKALSIAMILNDD